MGFQAAQRSRMLYLARRMRSLREALTQTRPGRAGRRSRQRDSEGGNHLAAGLGRLSPAHSWPQLAAAAREAPAPRGAPAALPSAAPVPGGEPRPGLQRCLAAARKVVH